MKKLFALLLSCIVLGVSVGCGDSDAPIVQDGDKPFDESHIRSLTDEVLSYLWDGSYDDVYSMLDENASKQLTPDMLEQAFVTISAEVGEKTDNIRLDCSYENDFAISTAVQECSEAELILTTVFNTDMQISGINLNFKPLETATVSTDKFSENAVTVGADSGYPLEGILTLPNNVEKPPVVLLVHGSGSSDKNETIFKNKPFEDIAHALAENGIASLRYDKRYFTYPEAAAKEKLNIENEVLDDVKSAIALLSADERIDGNNIFVLGHSLGGMLVPNIAYENQNVKGVISMAGSLRPLYEIQYDQNKDIEQSYLVKSSISDEELNMLRNQMGQVEKDIEVLRGDISVVNDDTILLGVPASYYKSLDEHSGMKYIDKIKVPMLILQGDADFQVYPNKDFALWQEVLGNRENVSFRLYEGLNHLMMETNGLKDASEYKTEGHVSSAVTADIAEFILNYSE